MRSRELCLVVVGAVKAELLARALAGPVTTLLPASLIQLGANVHVFLDTAAAAALDLEQLSKRPGWAVSAPAECSAKGPWQPQLTYVVTALGGWQFKLEAGLSSSATKAARLPYFVGGEQWWKVTDSRGVQVDGQVRMMKLKEPDTNNPSDWILIEPGATVELCASCDLKEAFKAAVASGDESNVPLKISYGRTPNSEMEGAEEVAGFCLWKPSAEEI